MRSWMVLLALMPACGFHSTAAPSDAMVDAPPDARLCFGAVLPICFPSAEKLPMVAKVFDMDTNIDTDDIIGTFCNQDNDQKSRYCVVAGLGVTLPVGKKLNAHGSRPLVLLSTTMMQILGEIDVSSHVMGAQPMGPGANPAAAGSCTFGVAAIPPPLTGGGGGGSYGASFGSKGGDGSDGAANTGDKGRAGGVRVGLPTDLRGGCPGGAGAVTIIASARGFGGDGGGALALIAPQVHVDAKINASGGGGHGGPAAAPTFTTGGGGGGSGGMIVIDSPMFTVGGMAKLLANGGGGAQGGACDNTATGVDGVDGHETNDPAQPALGSSGGGTGGNGGNGSVGTGNGDNGHAAMDSGATIRGGGGGGGGGGGFIYAPGFPRPTDISPPSSTP